MLGAVQMLRRYPVKSLLGEGVDATEVTERGLLGDRRLALLDVETDRVASAKQPRLWRGLLTLAATEAGDVVSITGPGGETVLSTDPDVDAVLSAWAGRSVRLVSTPPAGAALDRAVPEEVLRSGVEALVPATVTHVGSASPPGTFFDFAPLHLLTASTLDRIGSLGSRGSVEPARYRPNLVVATTGDGFVENEWLGTDIAVGTDLMMQVVAATERCAVPTLAHADLPRDTAALRVVAQHNRIAPMRDRDPEPCAGVYAKVLRPGRIRVGDEVRLA